MFFKREKFSHVLLSAIAVVMVWRGVWNLLDYFLLPDNFIRSNIISLAGGVVLLYLVDRSLTHLT